MKEGKSYWPAYIISAFICFGLFIGYIVYRALQTEVNLVRNDYYEHDKGYNDKMKMLERSKATGVDISFYAKNNVLEVRFPTAYDQKNLEGTLHFFRPSDANLDFKAALSLKDNTQQFDVSKLAHGRWVAQLNFSYEGKAYYIEENFTINR